MIQKLLKIVWATVIVAMLAPMAVPSAQAGVTVRSYLAAKALRKATPAISRGIRRTTRNFALEMISPAPHPTKSVILGRRAAKTIANKITARTATRAEYLALRSNQRLANRRAAGVRGFWDEEARTLAKGGAGSRNWSPQQIQELATKGKPSFNGKSMVGHHKYSAQQYPHLSDNPLNIVARTRREHFFREHGGRYGPTHGKPVNPRFPLEF